MVKIEDFAVRHKNKLKEIDWKSLDEKFWDSFYKEVAGEFNELIQWHESDFLQYKGKKYAYIKGQLCFHEDGRFKGDDTYGCLRVQAQWYSTRRFPFTLLAYRDRQELIKKYPTLVTFTFSPYMTYMRFHAGENNFIYFLMKYVIKKLKSKNSRDAKQLIKRNKKEWYKNYIKRKDESSWHYVGLGVEIYQNEEIKRKADIVKDLINAIGEFGLLEDELNRELVPWGFRKIQETCNKFNERLVYYKAAVRKAGLDV